MIQFPHRYDAAALISQSPDDQDYLAFNFSHGLKPIFVVVTIISVSEMKIIKQFRSIFKV
jgi:hypothetical protein